MTTVTGYDITAANWGHRPSGGQAMLYATGSAGIIATAAMRSAEPKAVLCDQAASFKAAQCDVFDVEAAAITLAELGEVIRDAWDSYDHADRPGQRKPLVYASEDDVTAVCNALDAAGLRNSGTGLFVANWSRGLEEAEKIVSAASGPYPIRAYQYLHGLYFDYDVFDAAWLADVSARPVTPTAPPGQWKNARDWTWKEAAITGTGLDGKLFTFHYDTVTGLWG